MYVYYYCMLTNSINTYQYSIPPVNALKPLIAESVIGSANNVPIINRAVIAPNVIRKSSNNIPPNYLRQVYMGSNSSSNGSLTESFIRSRASFSPNYMHNEITTRYDMISAIPMNILQIKKSVNKLA
jgi:hypothetical protein